MQTFLPYPDFDKSAQSLDYKRLGKQRVEALQILNVLEGRRSGWSNHPAVKMWCGYEAALRQYMRAMILEWVSRGYNNNMTIPPKRRCKMPPWIGRRSFHRAYKSNLKRKDEEYYSSFKVPIDLEYEWPNA